MGFTCQPSARFTVLSFRCTGMITLHRISTLSTGKHRAHYYGIQTLELMGGGLPIRAHALVLEWATIHRVELMEDWNLCESKQQPRKISPLA